MFVDVMPVHVERVNGCVKAFGTPNDPCVTISHWILSAQHQTMSVSTPSHCVLPVTILAVERLRCLRPSP